MADEALRKRRTFAYLSAACFRALPTRQRVGARHHDRRHERHLVEQSLLITAASYLHFARVLPHGWNGRGMVSDQCSCH